MILKRKNPGFCNMDRIIGAIEPYGVEEIAAKMGFSTDELSELLRANGAITPRRYDSGDRRDVALP